MKRIIGTSAFKNGFFKEDRFFLSACLLFGMGIFAGSVAVGRSSDYLGEIWQGYIIHRCSQGFFSMFLEGIVSLLIVIVLNYILGHCAIGKPFLFVVVLLFGIGKGVVFASFFLNYGFLGFIKTSILLGVQNCLMSVLVLCSAKTSAEHSKRIYDFGYKQKENSVNLKTYNIKYIFYGIFAVMLCVLDAVLASKIDFIIG